MSETNSLKILDWEKLEVGVKERVLKIQSRDLSFLREPIGVGSEAEEALSDEPIEELKKYFVLVALRVSPLGMFSKTIDIAWHRFLAFSALYREFCFDVFGDYLDHQPNTLETPIPRVALTNFLAGYEKYFGAVPALWFDAVDREALQRFCDTPHLSGSSLAWSGWAGFSSERVVEPLASERKSPPPSDINH